MPVAGRLAPPAGRPTFAVCSADPHRPRLEDERIGVDHPGLREAERLLPPPTAAAVAASKCSSTVRLELAEAERIEVLLELADVGAVVDADSSVR